MIEQNKQPIKILITGAAGFCGSNFLSEVLSKTNWNVDAIDNLQSGYIEFITKHQDHLDSNRLNFYQGCFASSGARLMVELGGYDYVFHFAATPRVSFSVENPIDTNENNLSNTVKLIDASVKGGVKRFIFSSSSSVYGGAINLPTSEGCQKDPKSPYAFQKSAIEDYLRMVGHLHGMQSVCLRYFNVVGPNQYGGSAYATAVSAWCDAIKHGKPLRSDWDGEQSRDLCPVQNVVQANLLAAQSYHKLYGECYNIACGERFTNNEILKMFQDRFGKLDVVTAPKRPGDVRHTLADISKAKRELGYQSTVDFREALELTWNWWKI